MYQITEQLLLCGNYCPNLQYLLVVYIAIHLDTVVAFCICQSNCLLHNMLRYNCSSLLMKLEGRQMVHSVYIQSLEADHRRYLRRMFELTLD